MATITASSKEVEVLIEAFAHKKISGFVLPFKDGKVSLENLNLDGEAEFKGLALGYSVRLSKADGVTAVVNLK